MKSWKLRLVPNCPDPLYILGTLKRATTTTSVFIYGTLDATSKVPFQCGKQKRDDISAMKMLHQMSVWVVVVVALRLVLIFCY